MKYLVALIVTVHLGNSRWALFLCNVLKANPTL